MFRCKYKLKHFIAHFKHNLKGILSIKKKLSLQCNFAIVQYGSKIRTELSLLDNEDGAESLQKVKEIKQIYNLTKTASAIHHVLWVYRLWFEIWDILQLKCLINMEHFCWWYVNVTGFTGCLQHRYFHPWSWIKDWLQKNYHCIVWRRNFGRQ